ncbi:alpha/beta hydrolase [Saccharothrix algeriensis]|uniref:Pimeloyl-ACP methyl ester carboxylesterase n=1 Tax=Saccharothrix algeriensis TaxID=173560 RepID=A0ABS2S0T9_9PSEU|nr:alpha/beta hydrolase [Saccharothrix algeriensis]MBM7809848.1 pimeloyl-ACP methyl ester carboxylesterase [Saccharothrix algeriensis]
MGSTARALGGLGAVLALVAGAVVPGAAAVASGAPQEDFRPAAVDWAPCPELPEVECGTLRLPVDWARPRGEAFDLALARRRATDPARRVGSLVIHPGGPGPSGVEFAFAAPQWFSPRLLARFDVVGFDPRGVGRSAPITCSADLIARGPSTRPTTQAGFQALGRHNRDLAADCRARSGPIFDHVDSAAVAEDVDAIRRALGERRISYYGLSYGTLVGQQYAERHGRNLRAMVNDSNLDHGLDAWSFNEGTARAAEDSFREFAKWCGATPSCALHGRDVGAFWDDLIARADRGEVTEPGDPTRPVPASRIVDYALLSFYDPSWTQLAEWLLALARTAPAAVRAAPAQQEEAVAFPFPAAFCQDWQIRPRSLREYTSLLRRADQLAPHMSRAFLGHQVAHSCVGLPDATNPQHRPRLDDAPKILLLNNLHDPSTGYDWARSLHRRTRGATVLLTYEGWGHGSYIRTDCVRDAADRYLITLDPPADGARCAPAESPELPVPTAARSAAPRPAPVGR